MFLVMFGEDDDIVGREGAEVACEQPTAVSHRLVLTPDVFDLASIFTKQIVIVTITKW
jgi:hypothetical protein